MRSDPPSNASAAPVWREDWLISARHCPSPNFGLRPTGMQADLVVVHSISLPPGVFGGPEIEQLFTNRLDWAAHPYFEQIQGMEVSSHFLIRRDGELVQFVGTDARAWHAGASEWCGRGNCNDFSIGVELEGLEGGVFDEAQYRQLTQLCHWLAMRHPIRHIAGHEHIAPGRKQDPGPGFDWTHFQQQLGWPSGCFQATPTDSPTTRG